MVGLAGLDCAVLIPAAQAGFAVGLLGEWPSTLVPASGSGPCQHIQVWDTAAGVRLVDYQAPCP